MCEKALTIYFLFDILISQGRKKVPINKHLMVFFIYPSCAKTHRKEEKFLLNSHKIKTRIFELGLTQEKVADDMSLDYSTFNLKVNNKRRIYADEVAKLCKILHISTSAELKEYFGFDFLLIKSCEKATSR